MATKLDAADPASLSVLRAIDAVYRKRASRLGRTLEPFNEQDRTGVDLLDTFVEHLKGLPMKVPPLETIKFGCDPHCPEDPNACPPCDDWELGKYEEYLKSLKIADATNLATLQDIHKQYVVREPIEQGRNPDFKLPEFVLPPPPPPELGTGELVRLFAFHQYLKTLPPLFSDKFGCDPHCPDDPNACPPCEDWEEIDYGTYLKSLQQRVEEG